MAWREKSHVRSEMDSGAGYGRRTRFCSLTFSAAITRGCRARSETLEALVGPFFAYREEPREANHRYLGQAEFWA